MSTPTLYADLLEALKERKDAVLVDRTATDIEPRSELWRVGAAVWWVWVYRDGKAFVYESIDDPVGVLAKLAQPAGVVC